MKRHFDCTACGKCCHGWLPLSISDALAHADIFPLFLFWMPVRPGGKSYDLTRELGIELKLKKRKRAAVRVFPVSYVPTHISCPALQNDGLCTIHESKPQRCRTMPLSGARAESDQLDLLIPKPDWDCDVSDTAPLIYDDKHITERQNFEDERQVLIADSKILKPFANLMIDGAPKLRMDLEKVANRPKGGHLILNFSTLVPRLADVDIFKLAKKQASVMLHFADQTAERTEFSDEHKRYVACAQDWQKILD
ncbi:MAG: zinc/iron-chelating domain-containing protein [Rhodospirillaceae bacterium]|nr:MAG: zinc/iron-chelating domain-containing protein [Rhodospirillaceae bacterium]